MNCRNKYNPDYYGAAVTLSGSCASNAGSYEGATGTPTGSDYGYCWCKMTYPVLGNWVYLGSMADSCQGGCAKRCAQYSTDWEMAGPLIKPASC
jgi:hypothetical protein